MRNLTTLWLLAVLPHGYASKPIQPPPFTVEGMQPVTSFVPFGPYFEGKPVFKDFNPATGAIAEVGASWFEQPDGEKMLNFLWGEEIFRKPEYNPWERNGFLHSCRPYGMHYSNSRYYGDQQCVFSHAEPRELRFLNSDEIGSACIPISGKISGGGERQFVGSFKTLIDCAKEAFRRFPFLTAVQRDSWIGDAAGSVSCWAYQEPAVAEPEKTNEYVCAIQTNAVPGLVFKTSGEEPIPLGKADSFDECASIARGRKAISYNKNTHVCQAYRVAFATQTDAPEGWISHFLPPYLEPSSYKAVPFVIEGVGYSMIASGAKYNDRLIFRRFDPTTGSLMDEVMWYDKHANEWNLSTKWHLGSAVLAVYNCDPYGLQTGPTGDFRKCSWKWRWSLIRGLESPLGFGSACIPTPGSISGGGEKRLVGSLDSLLDCAVEAKKKFPYATALERDAWPAYGWETKCYAYEGSSATIDPSDTAETGKAACVLKANKLPGMMIPEDTLDNFVRLSPQTDSFENCIAAARSLFLVNGGGISWHEVKKECRVYQKAWSVDSAQGSSGWLSAFVPIYPKAVPFVIEGIGWSMIASSGVRHNERLAFRRFDPATGGLMEGTMYYDTDSKKWQLFTAVSGGDFVLAIYNCDPYGLQAGPTRDFRKCYWHSKRSQIRGLESPEGFGSACIPTPGSISGGGEKRLVGTFDTILDCAVEAKKKFPYATALERDAWPTSGFQTKCYAYEGSSATIDPSSLDEIGKAACVLKANKLPGMMTPEYPDNFVRISPQTDSFENCIEAGRPLLVVNGGGISWHEDNKECRVYQKAWSVDEGSSGWLSAFVPIGTPTTSTTTSTITSTITSTTTATTTSTTTTAEEVQLECHRMVRT